MLKDQTKLIRLITQDNDFRRFGSLDDDEIQNKSVSFDRIFSRLLEMRKSRRAGNTKITLLEVSDLMKEVKDYNMQSQEAGCTSAPTANASSSSGSASGPQVTQEAGRPSAPSNVASAPSNAGDAGPTGSPAASSAPTSTHVERQVTFDASASPVQAHQHMPSYEARTGWGPSRPEI